MGVLFSLKADFLHFPRGGDEKEKSPFKEQRKCVGTQNKYYNFKKAMRFCVVVYK